MDVAKTVVDILVDTVVDVVVSVLVDVSINVVVCSIVNVVLPWVTVIVLGVTVCVSWFPPEFAGMIRTEAELSRRSVHSQRRPYRIDLLIE
jgi:hypothetical protein